MQADPEKIDVLALRDSFIGRGWSHGRFLVHVVTCLAFFATCRH
jgi:hypothetical protein